MKDMFLCVYQVSLNSLWLRFVLRAEQLLVTCFLALFSTGDVYLCGSSNAGKSTLFNALLKSDFCLPTAMDQISPATISSWPGMF